MHDFTNLVGRVFLDNYSEEQTTVHAAYVHDGELRLVVSRKGGTLYETKIEALRVQSVV